MSSYGERLQDPSPDDDEGVFKSIFSYRDLLEALVNALSGHDISNIQVEVRGRQEK